MPDGEFTLGSMSAMDRTLGARAEVAVMTPELARVMRKTMHYERQRPLSNDNIRRLGYELENGSFVPATPITICVLPEGTMKIVDGNHRLEAIEKSGINAMVTLIYIMVKDEEEVARIYSNLDIQMTRKWSHAIKAHAEFDDFPWAHKAVAAMGVVLSGFNPLSNEQNPRSKSRELRMETMREFRKPAQLLHDSCSGGPKANLSILFRRANMALALYTTLHQPTQGVEFWSGLVLDDGLRTGDPRKTLLDWSRRNPQLTASIREHLTAAVVCWNAYWEERSLAYIKIEGLKNYRIAGTPLHKGRQEAAADTPSLPVRRPCEDLPEAAPTMFQTGLAVGENGGEPVAYHTEN
jgi:hypothetical protein